MAIQNLGNKDDHRGLCTGARLGRSRLSRIADRLGHRSESLRRPAAAEGIPDELASLAHDLW